MSKEIAKNAFIRVNDLMVKLLNASTENDKDAIIRISEGLDDSVESFVDAIYAHAGVKEEDMTAYAERQRVMVKMAACDNPRALLPDLEDKK